MHLRPGELIGAAHAVGAGDGGGFFQGIDEAAGDVVHIDGLKSAGAAEAEEAGAEIGHEEKWG